MTEITQALPQLLKNVKRPGDFYAAGTAELPVVRIEVEGVGILGMPLVPAQAEALLRVATPAPYGRGPDTVIDANVRQCQQIAANSVHLTDPRWHRLLAHVTTDALQALGVESAAETELYKLLVYEPGGFFLPHRDTEKSPGMFATLVLVLPSEHTGGELHIEHEGRTATLDLRSDDLGLLHWAAFYADCRHELRPVRSGYRVALAYNLVRKNGKSPQAPDYKKETAEVAAVLRAWSADAEGPRKVVYPLAHHYSSAELSFAGLKNEDAAAATVLQTAAPLAGCTLRLAMVSIEESGSAEPTDSRRRRRYWEEEEEDDDESYEVIDIEETSWTLNDWRLPDDSHEALGRLELVDGELAPADALDDEEPDEDNLFEATGNEGATFERTYRRAALVLWPQHRELEVIAQGGDEANVAAIARLAKTAPEQALQLANIVVAGWEVPDGPQPIVSGGELRAQLLDGLGQLIDRLPTEAFLRKVISAGAFDGTETPALLRALARVDEATAAEVLARLVPARAQKAFSQVAELLELYALHRPGPALLPALTDLVAAAQTLHALDPWLRVRQAEYWIAGLGAALRALTAVAEQDLATALAYTVLQQPEQWPMDEVVVPLAIALRSQDVLGASLLRDAAQSHLSARIALPLAPPPDAQRDARSVTCKCESCHALRIFLADPVATTWQLRANEQLRRHVETLVRGTDTQCHTVAQGRPYLLVVTKTTATYDKRVLQRKADGVALAQLA